MTLTDFHSHILPSVDDGSASIDDSVTMLRMEAEQGITHVIATPHFYPQQDTPERFLQRRARAMAKLQEEMACVPGLPKITLGAEVYFFRGMSQSDHLPRLTIGQKSCILIEMPLPPWTSEMYDELEQIWLRQGIVPIVAHIDRYIRPLRTYGILQRLAQLPVLVQVNADFFLDKSTAGFAMRLLKEDRIHLMGSDCHNTQSRKPNMRPAMEKIRAKLGDSALERIHDHERVLEC